MVKLFIEHILGVGTNHRGLWGNTKAYYGTVEQQGRLTLHLHLLLWIENSLSPQTIRDRIADGDSKFQRKITEYLESLQCGQFIQGPIDTVQKIVESESNKTSYINPVDVLPDPPPTNCTQKECANTECSQCKNIITWWKKFKRTVDELLLKLNVHRCRPTSCFKNNNTSCKSRFPRDIVEESIFDPETGSITLKHGEAQLNTFTYLLTYLLRCNTDVTSLLSGTAIKAVISYVTDYITKSPLKTHSIFDVVRSVFDK
ncbi:hypothetical protein BD410DRAFT_732928, partial [Rickenella mellea]